MKSRDLRAYEYVNSAHEKFFTHSLNRTSPNSPTAAHGIDARMHFLEILLYPKKYL